MLLYRKHVITAQPYIAQLIEELEAGGLRPLPIFINGVEAHTVVGCGAARLRGLWPVAGLWPLRGVGACPTPASAHPLAPALNPPPARPLHPTHAPRRCATS